MSFTPRVIAFSGSLRRESFNQKLASAAASGAEAYGASVEVVSLADYPMPLFDEDLESRDGMPREARAFKELMIGAHGVIIASPEYNGSLSGALKNAIDWASRPEPGETPLIAFKGKVAGLLSASPGGLGGIRGLLHLRPLLGNIQMHVLPGQFCLGQAHERFDDAGGFKDASDREKAHDIGRMVADLAKRLHG